MRGKHLKLQGSCSGRTESMENQSENDQVMKNVWARKPSDRVDATYYDFSCAFLSLRGKYTI